MWPSVRPNLEEKCNLNVLTLRPAHFLEILRISIWVVVLTSGLRPKLVYPISGDIYIIPEQQMEGIKVLNPQKQQYQYIQAENISERKY